MAAQAARKAEEKARAEAVEKKLQAALRAEAEEKKRANAAEQKLQAEAEEKKLLAAACEAALHAEAEEKKRRAAVEKKLEDAKLSQISDLKAEISTLEAELIIKRHASGQDQRQKDEWDPDWLRKPLRVPPLAKKVFVPKSMPVPSEEEPLPKNTPVFVPKNMPVPSEEEPLPKNTPVFVPKNMPVPSEEETKAAMKLAEDMHRLWLPSRPLLPQNVPSSYPGTPG